MNVAVDLLREADRLGVRLALDGGDIVAEGPLTDTFVERLRRHKLEVIAALHGLTLDELRELAGKDWPELTANPELLECFADMVSIRHMRERGEVPPHYTARAFCRGCNATIPIFEGVGQTVEGCPWCLNRAAGRPVPRVPVGAHEQGLGT